MISRRTIEAFVSKSVVIRDKQKYGIRRIICKYGQGNSCVRTNKKIFGKDKLILGIRTRLWLGRAGQMNDKKILKRAAED